MVNERVIKLDQYEFSAVIKLINEKRNDLLRQQQSTEFITEILEKVIKAPTKRKSKFRREREQCER